jgi:hypothetical protein
MTVQIMGLSNPRSLGDGLGLAFTVDTPVGEAEFAVPTAELGQVLQFFASALTLFSDPTGAPTNDLFPIPVNGIGFQAGEKPGTQLMVVNVGGFGLAFEIPHSALAGMAKRALALSANDQGKAN